MNLRKLLCGLLALCLLLTMAPAALMEESAPEEQVVELGGEEVASDVVEADDFSVVDFDNSTDDTFSLPSDATYHPETFGLNSSTYLLCGNTLTVNSDPGYSFVSAVSKNVRVATVDNFTKGDKSINIDADAKHTGKARIDVKVQRDGSKLTQAFVINIVVYDGLSPAGVELQDVNGNAFPSSVSGDVVAGGVDVVANVVPTGVGGDIRWSSNASKVAEPRYALTLDGDTNTIVFKKKGTATITVSAGAAKTTFKVKVTDNYAPKTVSIKTDPASGKIGLGGWIGVYTVISPRPYSDAYVEYTLANTKYFYFAGDSTQSKTTATFANGLINPDGTCTVIAKGIGKVKITAKTYNGKKSSTTIEATDPFAITGIGMWGFYSKETYTAELYNENWTTDPTKPAKNAFIIVPKLYFGNNVELDWGYSAAEDAAATWQYANVKWESSNKKVATVGIYKDWDNGYFHNASNAILTYFGDEVYDQELAYAGLVTIKGTGTTKLTAKSKDGKKSFSITLKVIDSHKPVEIVLTEGSPVVVPVDEVVDLAEYFVVYPGDYYGTVTAAPTNSTSKVEKLGGTALLTKKTGDVKIKVKAGDKSKTFTLKIK